MATEAGHQPNRVYTDQSGNFHQNGGSIFDTAETARTATNAEINALHGSGIVAADAAALHNSGANFATDGSVGLAHWIGTFDFAVLGGLVSTINIAAPLPQPCLIMDGFLFVETAVTSAGAATVALGVQTTVDLLAATAKASLTLGAVLALIPDPATAASMVKTDGTHLNVQVTIATAALTAGKLRVALRVLPLP